MQCSYYNTKKYEELIQQNKTKEEAMNLTRCKNQALKGYTRCEEHGGGDIKEFFTRNLHPDEKVRYIQLFNNMVEEYKIPTHDQFQINLLALICRKIILSHQSEEPEKDITQILSIARELAITPREMKHTQVDINVPQEFVHKQEEIEAIVQQRIALTEKVSK